MIETLTGLVALAIVTSFVLWNQKRARRKANRHVLLDRLEAMTKL